ncbi:Ribosome biogenesis protein RPF2 [Fusarium oxysporum f. sp. albedinis]|nr:Ribosome biogenesis protein RPF2 [Fusarium oxysporum f. sp. albedinis]
MANFCCISPIVSESGGADRSRPNAERSHTSWLRCSSNSLFSLCQKFAMGLGLFAGYFTGLPSLFKTKLY